MVRLLARVTGIGIETADAAQGGTGANAQTD
jgi:hypothetical protein